MKVLPHSSVLLNDFFRAHSAGCIPLAGSFPSDFDEALVDLEVFKVWCCISGRDRGRSDEFEVFDIWLAIWVSH